MVSADFRAMHCMQVRCPAGSAAAFPQLCAQLRHMTALRSLSISEAPWLQPQLPALLAALAGCRQLRWESARVSCEDPRLQAHATVPVCKLRQCLLSLRTRYALPDTADCCVYYSAVEIALLWTCYCKLCVQDTATAAV